MRCYGEKACMILADAETDEKVKEQAIMNSDTIALAAVEIALMRAYPERMFGRKGGIVNREPETDIPYELRTRVWNCFRHPNTKSYEEKTLIPLYNKAREDQDTESKYFDIRDGRKFAKRSERPAEYESLSHESWNHTLRPQPQKKAWTLKVAESSEPKAPQAPATSPAKAEEREDAGETKEKMGKLPLKGKGENNGSNASTIAETPPVEGKESEDELDCTTPAEAPSTESNDEESDDDLWCV
jgi:hypothetical protein